MSLRPSFRAACRALALRSRPLGPRQESLAWAATRRGYANDSGNVPPLRKAAGAVPPEGQSTGSQSATPAGQQSLTRDEGTDALVELARAARKDSPGAELGGLTEAQEQALYRDGAIPPTPSNGDPLRDLEVLASGGLLANPGDVEVAAPTNPGHKFPMPTLPLPPHSHLKERYHPVLDQLTNLMMRDGKKAQAQRNMAMVLNFLRTSPPPIINPRYPLLPGAPPPAHLPLNPVLYLTLAVDSVAPLVKIRRIAGGAGGGRPLELPAPLAVRQRRRAAFQWILDVVDKKPSKGSGRTQFAHRLAEEIIAVVEGRSGVWDKRLALHKLGTATRANLMVKPVKANSK
ncbi:37S ribosomal protein S7, mitochondrial [Colletotrichum chlorophyti]|uniref:Small ribosomal subunit protein uS7m n=1 Tax=Colletotrichum chlorophyti TaxID=708187 RepID=A0A1Q8RLB2_9PEZI|nr:37S ribosomal protein S7, mitochondrial [Colletotrichum chlorophyti]